MQEVLRKSTGDTLNSFVQKYHEKSKAIIPAIYALGTRISSMNIDLSTYAVNVGKVRTVLQTAYALFIRPWLKPLTEIWF